MAEGCRLTKMSLFSGEVKTPLAAEWLLHLDPKAEIRQRPNRIEAVLGGAALDLYRLAPEAAPITWGRHAVAKPEAEPFTFRETQRVVIRPPFSGQDAFLLTLLHARAAGQAALGAVEASVRPGRVHVEWSCDGRRTAFDWDLAAWRLTFP
jgi:hypothetical protein